MRPARRLSWTQVRPLLLFLAFGSALLALFFWLTGAVYPYVNLQYAALLTVLVVLSFAPALLELASRTFDPFDAKHLFLAYFFLLLVVPGICKIWLGFDPTPEFAVPEFSDALRVRALAAILLGLALFVGGCYAPLGTRLGQSVPCLPAIKYSRISFVAFSGITLGLVAFFLLMRSAGGIQSFLADRQTWRTSGVLGGVGYLTFPITAVLPASVLLLLLQRLVKSDGRRHWTRHVVFLPAIALSLLPILVLGFRGDLVPILLSLLAAWHYTKLRFSLLSTLTLAILLAVFLTVYGSLRDTDNKSLSSEGTKRALLFRVPGQDTVERVIGRLDNGELHRGSLPAIAESATILVPRSAWSDKPVSTVLIFDDIFFSDYYIRRGDPIDGIKSGLSPTVIGELLWIGGIAMVALGMFALGVIARMAVVWRNRGSGRLAHIFIYAIFMAKFSFFVEVFQNALNSYVMLGVMGLGMTFALTVSLRWRKPPAAPARSLAHESSSISVALPAFASHRSPE